MSNDFFSQGQDNSDEETDSSGHRKSLVRRNFLKATGAGLVSAFALSGATAASEDYDVVEVGAGENWSYRLDNGEVFENVLFDCTADETRVSIAATGENWTIRNVGFRGVHDQSGGHAVFSLEAAGGTDCLVENVWMGDGSSEYDGAGSSETAAWVSPESTGEITFQHCYFQGWKDNAIYASAPGRDGNGAVIVDSCYASNNNHADYRIGATGSVIKNSVVEHTESGSGVRGLWCWYNEGLEVHNCDIETEGYGAAVHAGPDEPAGVTLYDCETSGSLVEDGRGDGEITLASGNGTDPDTSVPSGVPTSAEEAASGGPTETTSYDEVALISTADATGFDYEIEVSGDAYREDLGETPSGNPIHSGRAAEYAEETEDGWIFGGTLGDGYGHGFMVEGDILNVTVSDWETGEDPVEEYSITRNGECIIACGEDSEPEEVALISTAEATGFDYEMEVTGEASRKRLGETPSGNAIHSGRSAEWKEETEDGWIFGGTLGDGYGHGFMVEGDIVRFEATDWETGEDPVEDYWVEREGECIIACGSDEEECTEDLPNTIVIDGTDTEGVTEYMFSVSGSVEAEPELTSVEDGGLPWDNLEDDVSDDTVIGVVGNGQDGYRFSGSLTSNDIGSDLSVSITFDDC